MGCGCGAASSAGSACTSVSSHSSPAPPPPLPSPLLCSVFGSKTTVAPEIVLEKRIGPLYDQFGSSYAMLTMLYGAPLLCGECSGQGRGRRLAQLVRVDDQMTRMPAQARQMLSCCRAWRCYGSTAAQLATPDLAVIASPCTPAAPLPGPLLGCQLRQQFVGLYTSSEVGRRHLHLMGSWARNKLHLPPMVRLPAAQFAQDGCAVPQPACPCRPAAPRAATQLSTHCAHSSYFTCLPLLAPAADD